MVQPLAAGLTAVARQTKWETERQFRTMWDAVAWLEKNHPEIAKTLDETYRPRGKR